jgi:hypothetical protein
MLRDSLKAHARDAGLSFGHSMAIFRSVSIAGIEADLHDSFCKGYQSDYDGEGHLSKEFQTYQWDIQCALIR